jgi:hypothetical protein
VDVDRKRRLSQVIERGEGEGQLEDRMYKWGRIRMVADTDEGRGQPGMVAYSTFYEDISAIPESSVWGYEVFSPSVNVDIDIKQVPKPSSPLRSTPSSASDVGGRSGQNEAGTSASNDI